MKELIRYLLDHLILDFEGNFNLEMAREFLQNDSSADSQALLAKLHTDQGTSDMLITLADCLKDALPQGINEEVVLEQIQLYTES